jgi:hypothetical protein
MLATCSNRTLISTNQAGLQLPSHARTSGRIVGNPEVTREEEKVDERRIAHPEKRDRYCPADPARGEFTESDFTGPLELIWLRVGWKLANRLPLVLVILLVFQQPAIR